MSKGQTVVSTRNDDFAVNGALTYEGMHHGTARIEGLLLNSRMVQGIFDDRNAATLSLWNYPDGPWDPARNTREFVRAMPQWQAHGLNSFTLNLQGGSPFGYSKEQPWVNSAFDGRGALDMAYLQRLTAILDRADALGMVVILGLFYFGQFEILESEPAILAAVDNTVDWLLDQAYTHVLIEVGNEVDIRRRPFGYGDSMVESARCSLLIERIQQRSSGKLNTPASRLLASTSLKGNSVPSEALLRVSDFVLLHGNGVEDPRRIAEMVRACRHSSGYRGQPILFNEDDHYRFEEPENNMMAALSEHAGWGFFDYRRSDEGHREGFQSVPVDWTISSDRKRAFFNKVAEVTQLSPVPNKQEHK